MIQLEDVIGKAEEKPLHSNSIKIYGGRNSSSTDDCAVRNFPFLSILYCIKK